MYTSTQQPPLSQCAPSDWPARYAGKTLVIKYGGSALQDPQTALHLAQDLNQIIRAGVRCLIVHGAGPQIGQMLQKLSIDSHFVQGMRFTDDRVMQVVEMVMGGSINQQIVSVLNQQSVCALGMSGKDCNLIRAQALTLYDAAGAPLEIGRVGAVQAIDAAVLDKLHQVGIVPVIAPIGVDQHGQSYNINADLVAGAVAAAVGADALFLLTDTSGIQDRAGERLGSLTGAQVEALIADGTIHGGMLPKVECALQAIKAQVPRVLIADAGATQPLLSLLDTAPICTEIIAH